MLIFKIKKFKLIANICSDFGALPNCGEVDLAAHDKVAVTVEDGRLKPDKEWLHLIWFVHFFIGCYFIMRGGVEMKELVGRNFIFGEVLDDNFKGRRCLKIKGLIDKSASVSVKNPTRRNTYGSMDIIECLEYTFVCVVFGCLN